MEIELKMPDLATTDSEIKVVRWMIEIGQPIKRGHPLLEVETDKAIMEVESVATGILKAVRVHPDELISVGHVIAVITTEDAGAVGTNPVPAPIAENPQEAQETATAESACGGPAVAGRVIPLNPKQRVIARRMQESKQTIPHFYLETSVNAEPMIARRNAACLRLSAQPDCELRSGRPDCELRSGRPDCEPRSGRPDCEPRSGRQQAGADLSACLPALSQQACDHAQAGTHRQAAPKKIAWDAFFVHAVGKALKKFDRMGLRLETDHLAPSGTDAVGVAVDHEGELHVIAIPGPASKTPEQISDEIRAVVGKLRAGDPEARKLRPANITVTNLGGVPHCGIERFTAIINPPEASILAIGKVAPAAVVQNGKIVAQNRVSLTLSVDHRVVNGWYAAEFLGAIVQELENL